VGPPPPPRHYSPITFTAAMTPSSDGAQSAIRKRNVVGRAVCAGAPERRSYELRYTASRRDISRGSVGRE
jgi:hypothetical protein